VPKDLTQPTQTGAAISICCVLFMIFLLVSEFVSFIVPVVNSTLFVHNVAGNDNIDGGKIQVSLDISVFMIKCQCTYKKNKQIVFCVNQDY
jgi:hypothetical protein